MLRAPEDGLLRIAKPLWPVERLDIAVVLNGFDLRPLLPRT